MIQKLNASIYPTSIHSLSQYDICSLGLYTWNHWENFLKLQMPEQNTQKFSINLGWVPNIGVIFKSSSGDSNTHPGLRHTNLSIIFFKLWFKTLVCTRDNGIVFNQYNFFPIFKGKQWVNKQSVTKSIS